MGEKTFTLRILRFAVSYFVSMFSISVSNEVYDYAGAVLNEYVCVGGKGDFRSWKFFLTKR